MGRSWNPPKDIDALYKWSIDNKMKFHPQKCKVLSVVHSMRSDNLWNAFPFQSFYYKLNDTDLNFVDNENDLGVIITSSLNFRDQCLALYLQASSRLGLLKRTLYFVKDSNQKRAFYLALVRSLFEHCSVIWRPTTEVMSNKLEAIQRRAVKWILAEDGHHYNDFEYLMRLKNLDLLPLKYKFDYTDLVLFHNIYYKKTVVGMPNYISPVSEHEKSRLRPVINPPKEHNGSQVANSISSMRANKLDRLCLKCSVEARSPAFKNSFFFRTHLSWNLLPTEIKETTVSSEFQNKLKHHMWDVILDPH